MAPVFLGGSPPGRILMTVRPRRPRRRQGAALGRALEPAFPGSWARSGFLDTLGNGTSMGVYVAFLSALALCGLDRTGVPDRGGHHRAPYASRSGTACPNGNGSSVPWGNHRPTTRCCFLHAAGDDPCQLRAEKPVRNMWTFGAAVRAPGYRAKLNLYLGGAPDQPGVHSPST